MPSTSKSDPLQMDSQRLTNKMCRSIASSTNKTDEGTADFDWAARHTCASERIRSGVSLPEGKELARHSEIHVTLRYTHNGIVAQALATVAQSPSLSLHHLVAARGVEPRRLSAPDPKSGVSANFTKRPYFDVFSRNTSITCDAF